MARSRASPIRGKILFEERTCPIPSATVYLRIEDTARSGAASTIISQAILNYVALEPHDGDALKFSMPCPKLTNETIYVLTVHIDCSKTGTITKGDYISTKNLSITEENLQQEIIMIVKEVR